jgi:hypothetical protein
MFIRVFDGAIELGTNLILGDCSAVTSVLSGLERYNLSVASAQNMLYRDPRISLAVKVAVVGTPPVIDGFAALVASNRGITTETFSDTTDAVALLNRFARRVYCVCACDTTR